MVVLEYNTASGKKLVDIEDANLGSLITAAARLKKLTSCPCNDAERTRLKSQIQGIITAGVIHEALPEDFYEMAHTEVAQLSVGVWHECARQA